MADFIDAKYALKILGFETINSTCIVKLSSQNSINNNRE